MRYQGDWRRRTPDVLRCRPERGVLVDSRGGELGLGREVGDWDVDGLWDLVVARANREGECRFFFHKNVGDREHPSFAEPEIISIDGGEMMSERNRTGIVSITVSDWLGDGRPHLLVGIGGDKDGKVLLFENMALGDGDEPRLTDGRPLTLKDGTDLTLPRAVLANPVVVDWDGRGRKDLLVGSHRGLLHLFRDEGTQGSRPALLPHETIRIEPSSSSTEVG